MNWITKILRRTFAYLGTHEIEKTTVAAEAIKCGLSNVVVPKGTFYCKNNQGNGREEMRCQKQCKHCLECENLQ